MFWRSKKNKSGSISIQVIRKEKGKTILVKTIGSSSNEMEIKLLKQKAVEFISTFGGQQALSLTSISEIAQVGDFIKSRITSLKLAGPHLVIGKVFNEIGFDSLGDNLLKDLVISRIIYPASKLRTTRFIADYLSVNLDVKKIYRYLDKVHSEKKGLIQEISYKHTLKVLDNAIKVVFYDVTTLYFESDNEDDLRKTGFSKDGKHQHPQIVLGLLVSVNAYPLAYQIFEGNKFEGHTMLPIINEFKQKYAIEKMVVVADSGLMSASNLEEIDKSQYDYIIGARIKSENKEIKDKIHLLNLADGESSIIKKDDKNSLIISYSTKRAAKDRHNRSRGLERLEKLIKSGKMTKTQVNNRGYNKYLKLEGEMQVQIDYTKYEEDSKWDGLKGYITNTNLTAQDVIDNYKHLWKIEKAFRITKGDLRIRPVYHRLPKRIEAHVCIAFTAYKVYKELERQLKIKKSEFSIERFLEIINSIYSVEINHNDSKANIILAQSESQKAALKLFDIDFG